LTATLEGRATITASHGGNVAAASDELILSWSITLFEATNPLFSGTDGPKPSVTLSAQSFEFALPFPEHLANGRDPLPPSQSLSQQGTYCNIAYTVKVDMVRKGLRRHQRITIPIMYLPRSAPPCPVQLYLNHDPMTDYENEEERFTTVDLHTSNSARGALEQLQTSVQLTLPSPKIYSSGDSVPLMLTLSCSRLPSLPQLLVSADSLDIHLIRRAKITLSLGDSLQETEVTRAELQDTDNSVEGVTSSQWMLQMGDSHRQVSWKIEGIAEVKYFIRVAFKPPPCSMIKHLPRFKHDEVIKLTSDPWLDPVMTEEVQNLPSLGLAPAGLTVGRFTPASPGGFSRL